MNTPREQEILDVLLSGHAPPEVAERLSLSIHTVHNYLKRLRRRHHVHTTLALAVKLLRAEIERVTRERDIYRRDLAALDRRRGTA